MFLPHQDLDKQNEKTPSVIVFVSGRLFCPHTLKVAKSNSQRENQFLFIFRFFSSVYAEGVYVVVIFSFYSFHW